MALLEHLPALMVVILFCGAFLMPLLFRWIRSLCAPLMVAILAAVSAMAVIALVRVYQLGPQLYHLGGWPPPWGIELKVDLLRGYMLLVLFVVSLWIFIYALRDLENELKKELAGWYYTLYALLVGSIAGIALTNDLFNLFVMMEICAITACAIISIKEERECLEASFKYLILSAMGTGCFLLGVAMLYMATGYLNYDYLHGSLVEALTLYPRNLLLAAALFIVAFGTKAALFPLHVWLPDAHASAPSPSSAMLSGLVIKIYAFALLLIFYEVFPAELLQGVPLNDIILWLGSLGAMFGSIYAMMQTDLKKMLAFSSIGQIGYIFMGIGFNQNLALVGGLYHIAVHAVTKAMLFMAAGTIIYATGVRKISDLAGIGRYLPLTMAAFAVGSASMIGLPGTGGLISKWYLSLGALEMGRPFFVLIILISSLLNAVYYMPIVINAFLHHGDFKPRVKPVPRIMLASLVFGMLGIIVTGVFSRPAIVLLEDAVSRFFLN
ncbi:MAG TPA: monovalent cation/H+ antiporter subunit D family protein [Firmicutes bacterium]|nr:monovalent cation/H+ antiporter subunit D family protein [Bacillota bacterium]